jgi:hypothetical protein
MLAVQRHMDSGDCDRAGIASKCLPVAASKAVHCTLRAEPVLLCLCWPGARFTWGSQIGEAQ